MSRWTEADLVALQRKRQHAAKATTPGRRSKYGNERVRVDGIVFDSKHEAQHYAELKLRLAAGEITDLRVHVPFPLVTRTRAGEEVVVAEYIADFAYLENGVPVVADTKGRLTEAYKLKRRWLALQDGIEIREVYKRP